MTPEERAAQIADSWGKRGAPRAQLIADIAEAIRAVQSKQRELCAAMLEDLVRLTPADGWTADLYGARILDVAAALRASL